jgi:hypothetical protein
MKFIFKFCLIILFFTQVLFSQWATTPDQNNIIVDLPINDPMTVQRPSGGIISVWEDQRNGLNNLDIYCQYVDSLGYNIFQPNGLPICNAPGNQKNPFISTRTEDMGYFIAWEDYRQGSGSAIYCQYIDSTGNPRWQQNGIRVSPINLGFHHHSPVLFKRYIDTLYVGWIYTSFGVDVFKMQKLDAQGNLLWDTSGVNIANYVRSIKMNGSSIVDGVILGYDIYDKVYINIIRPDGSLKWSQPKVIAQIDPSIIDFELNLDVWGTDYNNAMALITWSNTNGNFAQLMDTSGTKLWGNNGINLSPYNGSYRTRALQIFNLAAPGNRSFFFVWADGRRPNVNKDLYARLVDLYGNSLWPQGEIAVSTEPNYTPIPEVVYGTDFVVGSGSAIVSWVTNEGIKAQNIDLDGNFLWDSSGVLVSSEAPINYYPYSSLVGGGLYHRGAIITFLGSGNRLKTKYINSWGYLGDVTSLENESLSQPNNFYLSQNYPNPFNPTTKISWQSPVSSHQTIKVYDVLGNEVATLVDEYKSAGSYEVEFSAGSFGNSSKLSSGTYFYRLNAGEFIETKKMILLR